MRMVQVAFGEVDAEVSALRQKVTLLETELENVKVRPRLAYKYVPLSKRLV